MLAEQTRSRGDRVGPLAMALGVLASACSTTLAVERPFSSARLGEVNSMLRDRTATVTYETRGGERIRDVASDISFDVKMVRWTLWESEFARRTGTPPGQPVEAPIEAVRRVTLCDGNCRALGALEGVGFGVLVSLVVGLAGAATCHGEYCAFWFIGPAFAIVPLGALFGLGAGHRTIVDVQPPAPPL